MKVANKNIIGCVAAIIIVSGITYFAVSAQDPALSDQKIEQIRGNCLTTKNTLTQLHASDALLRVNRGQLYESLYTKLIERFNTRLSGNKLNNDDLKKIAGDYNIALQAFRLDYKNYEEQLAKTIDVDCSVLPVQFYDAVVSSRSLREVVHKDVEGLNKYIDQYQLALDQFDADYNQKSGGNN